jgi:hypothetical protein
MSADEALAAVEQARVPGDLFGEDAKGDYRRLAMLIHPDRIPGDRAAKAFAKLAALWERYCGGTDVPFARGDIADLFRDGDTLAKYPRRPADNDLMGREAAALRRIARELGDGKGAAFFPRLLSSARQRDPGTGVVRQVNTLALAGGFVTLEDVQAAYPGGVDPRDAAWMWRRLLAALGWARRSGVVHGAVLPPHVLIHPGEHGLILADWCYSSAGPGRRVPALVTRYRDWYPAEAADKTAEWGPAADIFMATRCMTALMGERMPWQLGSFAAGCMLPRPSMRPQDAHALLAEFNGLIERLYGPRKFRPFTMPARPG